MRTSPRLPPFEQHLGEPDVVGRGRGQAAAAGGERRRTRVLAVHRRVGDDERAAQLRVVGHEPAALLLGHPERGVVHAERIQDALFDEGVERLAGGDLDDAPQDVGRHAVVPPRSRTREQRELGHAAREVVEALGPAERIRLVVEAIDGRVAEEPVGETRGVGQQVLDGDRTRRRHAVSAVGQDRHVGELGHELRDRVVERDLAFLDQDHHRDAGHRLGHRVDAEDVAALQGVAGRGVARPDRRPVDDLPPARHHRHHAGQPAVVDIGLHRRRDAGQRILRHPDRAGARVRESGVVRGGRLRERRRREHRQRERRSRNEPREPDRVTCALTNHERPLFRVEFRPGTDPRCTPLVQPAHGTP